VPARTTPVSSAAAPAEPRGRSAETARITIGASNDAASAVAAEALVRVIFMRNVADAENGRMSPSDVSRA
jgi:hypothetical protein